MSIHVIAVGREDVPSLAMPDRFRKDVTYFMTPAGERGAPQMASGEYWIHPDDARRWLDDGVLMLVSPLDSTKSAEVEITEEQESWLEWLIAHGVSHVRLERQHSS
ncbi:MAG: hypothetical protein WD875_09750 [Pirellulales bacterium]